MDLRGGQGPGCELTKINCIDLDLIDSFWPKSAVLMRKSQPYRAIRSASVPPTVAQLRVISTDV